MSETNKAVFLSYASQDAEAARRICEALRAAGIEVWFDQSELRGGDAWDQSIRKQIKSCALFLPVISHTTHDRREGYFRLEWRLAVDRCLLMDANQAFLLPIVIDDTREDDERVPERFRRCNGRACRAVPRPRPSSNVYGVCCPRRRHIRQDSVRRGSRVCRAFDPKARSGTLAVECDAPRDDGRARSRARLPRGQPTRAIEAWRRGGSRHRLQSTAALPRGAAVCKPERRQGQDYFSDGLTEELLNSLAQINELQVAARTSSFSFKEHPDIATVAHKLNVGAVLEGSVRRSAHTIRITAQLINAVTGFHLWSKTYDRDFGDMLKLQTDIAIAVTSALKVTLLGDVAARVELGGTRNPAALDAYLRAAKAYSSRRDTKDLPAAIAAYTEAIRLDPHYALAFAARSLAFTSVGAGPRPSRRCVKAMTRRKRMRARRLSSRPIWPRPISHWRKFRRSTSRLHARE